MYYWSMTIRPLKNVYAANAKLFHDFQNHIDVMYHYLLKTIQRKPPITLKIFVLQYRKLHRQHG